MHESIPIHLETKYPLVPSPKRFPLFAKPLCLTCSGDGRFDHLLQGADLDKIGYPVTEVTAFIRSSGYANMLMMSSIENRKNAMEHY